MMDPSSSSETLPLLTDGAVATEHGARNHCFRVIQEEFVLRNFGFEFRPEVFYNCQWKIPKALYIFYRLILVIYATVAIILSMVIIDPNKVHRPWPVWLTHWSYLLLTVHLYMALIGSILHFRDDYSRDCSTPDLYDSSARRKSPFYTKLNWMIFAVASAAAIIVSIIYFGVLYPRQGVHYLSVVDVNLHLMNTVIVILEFCISAFPVRLLHFVYVILYGLLYTVFSIIYWLFDHSNVLYPGVLDWNTPGRTLVVIVLLSAVGIPVLQIFLFSLYCLRRWVFNKFYRVHSF